MLKSWLSRLEAVKRAETAEEREAIYRFRYQVYVEEFGRELGSPDHAHKRVTDADDEKETTTLLYTGTPEKITGTVRLRHWAPGEVPHHDFEELSMERFPTIENLRVAEIGRLMVRPSMRGKLVIASLLRASYEHLAGQEQTDLVFCYCSPGLVRYYQQLAMRPYGGRMVLAPDGIMVPLVSVMSDHAYYAKVRSLFAPMVRRYFGRGKRKPVDMSPFEHLFEPAEAGVEFEPERVRAQAAQALAGAPATGTPLLDLLPPECARRLLDRGLILDVEPGALVTRAGFAEKELFIALEGRFTANIGGVVQEIEPGELFGEDALIAEDGRRSTTVRAETAGRLLVLNGRAFEKLARREPERMAPAVAFLQGREVLAAKSSLASEAVHPDATPLALGALAV